jgi:pheromone shutdown protein TraB
VGDGGATNGTEVAGRETATGRTKTRRGSRRIREVDPDIVAVELDERRFERLERGARRDVRDVARDLPPGTAVVYGTLKAIQASVVRLYGLDPGQTDMEAAVDTAAEQGVEVALIDDPIDETMSALAARLDPFTSPRMVVRMQTQGPEPVADQLELLSVPFREIDSGADVQPAIAQLRRLVPEIAEVLIDRRDRAMAERLHALRQWHDAIVVVVGAGHHNGVRQHLATFEANDGVPEVDVPVRSSTREVTRIPVS